MKFKKFLAPIMAVAITASAMPVSSVSAVGPRVFIDITYENNEQVRADIIFDDIDPACTGGFHIYVGDGWTLKTKQLGKDKKVIGTNKGYNSDELTISTQMNGDNGFFIFFTGNQNYDLNDKFYSFYLEKNENFNSENAYVNVVFQSTPYVEDMIATCTGKEIITARTYTAPSMTQAQEYRIGDANNDGRVNAIDATWIRMAIEGDNRKQYIVKDIIDSYKDIFPEANCAAAPDADSDGYINFIDADKISQYYADMSTIGYSNTDIGKLEFYEIFE